VVSKSSIRPTPGRTPRSEATRQRLLRAGRKAFARKGLAATNLRDDVLSPAGVSVGSFYHRYRDKTELLLDILSEHAEAFRARLHDVHTPAPGRTLREIAHSSYALMFEVAERNEDVLRIQMRERHSSDPRVRHFLAEDRRRWTARLAADHERLAEVSGHDVSGELVAELVASLALGAVARWLELPPAERPSERKRLLDGLVRFTLGGVPALDRRRHTAEPDSFTAAPRTP
jgi:AcrR family transcriptional regulator